MHSINCYLYSLNDDYVIDNYQKFSSYRLEKIKRNTNDKDALIESLLIDSIEKYLDKTIDKLDISVLQNGKLEILNIENLHISISHSNHYLLVVIADVNIGADIEFISSKHIKVAKKLYDNQVSDIYKIIKDWTIIESYVKYFDLTMLINLKKIKILDDRYGTLYYQTKMFNDQYYYSIAALTPFLLNIIDNTNKRLDKIIKK